MLYQDYVLEHLSIAEQLLLFEDASPEFAQAKDLFLREPKHTPQILLGSAQTSACSSTSPNHRSKAPEVTLSEPDFYLMRVHLEEKVKHALQHNLHFESPLCYVQRFFENTFPSGQFRSDPALARWRSETEMIILNTAFIPLSLYLHPVLLAGGFLAWARANVLKQAQTKASLPEELHGHPWFKFVDPEISAEDLQLSAETVDAEIKFLFQMMSAPQEHASL